MSLTEYVVDFVMNLEHEDIPEGVQRTVKEHILDGYGLALSGCEEEGHAIMRRYAASAVAELVGASGRDLLTAYVAGEEVA